MGAIARSAANLVTTSGVWLKGGVNNASMDNITTLPSAAGADGITLISSQTASSSASISFTSGITSTYKAYKFVFVNMHPATNGAKLTFNLSTDSGSNYNVTKTTTAFRPFHYESGTSEFAYNTSNDLAQSTDFQPLCENQGNNNDDGMSGFMQLFNPASTTYVKHFISCANMSHNALYPASSCWFVSGYGNTSLATNAIQFKMDTGNIDDGKIYMYGIK